MAFAIMRCKKLKGAGSLSASLSHCFRERDTPNADAEMTMKNIHFGAKSTQEALAKLDELLPSKRRKDAVLAVEYIMTASPDWWAGATPEKHALFFQRARAWLAEKYGKENVFVESIHNDESTPHLSAFVVPKTPDGRLSAKSFIGSRELLRLDQTTFAEAIQGLGLERGIKGSKAKHQTLQSFYGALELEQTRLPEVTVNDLTPKTVKRWLVFSRKESTESLVERVNKKIKGVVTPISQKASTARFERSRAQKLQELAQQQSMQLESIKKAFHGLSHEDLKELAKYVKSLKSERLRAKKDAIYSTVSHGRDM